MKDGKMLDHRQTLKDTAASLNKRITEFGPEENILSRTARTASVFLNKEVNEYDISMILHCYSLAHLQNARSGSGFYSTAIQHLSLAAQFSGPEPEAEPNSVSVAEQTIDDGIAAMAAKYSPKHPYNVSIAGLDIKTER